MIVCTCGFENADGDPFCGGCGSFLEWDGQRVEPEPGPAEPEPEPAEPEPAVEPELAAEPEPAAAVEPKPEPASVEPEPAPVLPQAVKPAVVPAKPRPKRPEATRQINPGDKICAKCGEGNDPARRFCRRCGNSLAAARVAAAVPWYRKLWNALFGKKQRLAGERPKVRRRTHVFRTIGILIVLAIIAVVVLLVTGHGGKTLTSAEKAADNAAHTLLAGYSPVHPTKATATSQSSAHPASNLIDSVTNTSWQSGGVETHQNIVIPLSASANIARVGFLNGDQDNPQDFTTEARAKTVTLVLSGGAHATRRTVALHDSPDFQNFAVSDSKATRLTVEISSVYPAAAGKGGKNVAIAEIELFSKK